MEEIQESRKYTYKDYKNWDTKERWELLDGVPYMMASPNKWHQFISGYMCAQFFNQLLGTSCTAYSAPSDVRLFPEWDESDKTIVQPDIYVVCGNQNNRGAHQGAPIIVIEILSDSNSKEEMDIKMEKYFQAGVKEYWIVRSEYEVIRYLYNPISNSYAGEEITGTCLSIKTYNLCKDVEIILDSSMIPKGLRTPQLRLL